MQTNDITTTGPSSTPIGGDPVAYKGERVMTTAMAAKAFGADEKTLSNNHDRNRRWFRDGVHFHKVEGDALRELKNSPSLRGLVGIRAPHLVLWTERGIARHAKILETDTAWEIFETLEDTYFRVKTVEAAKPEPTPTRLLRAREARLSFNGFLRVCKMMGVTGNHALLSANSATKEMVGVDVLGALGMPRLLADTDGAQINTTDLGRQLGMGARDTNIALIDYGYAIRFRDSKGNYVYEPTEKGRSAGGRLTATGKKHSNGTPVTQLVWSTETARALRDEMGGVS